MKTKPDESQSILFFGEAVKALPDGVVEGYLVRFNSPDTTPGRDYFDANTDFDFEGKSVVRSARYHHGFSVKAKKTKYGAITITRLDDGLYAHLKMDFSQPYASDIYDLAKDGKLFWSSGSATHLVEKEPQPNGTTYIKGWPLIEGSLTPNPADKGAFAFAKSAGELNLDDPLIKEEPVTTPAVTDPHKGQIAIKSEFYSARGVLSAVNEALYLPPSLINLAGLADVLRQIADKVQAGDLDAWSETASDDAYFSIKAGARNSKRDKQALNAAHDSIVTAGAECPSATKANSDSDTSDLEAQVVTLTAEVDSLKSKLEAESLLRSDAEGQLADLLKLER